jgi:hypothetical protein
MKSEPLTTEKAIELINAQIKDAKWNVDYHEQKLVEYRLKLQLAESMLELYSNPETI